MYKKTITYTDFFGNEHTDDFYFNLTEAETVELNIRQDLETIKNTREPNQLMDAFKHFIQMSFGLRTPEGGFIKEERAYKLFISGNAYSKLFMELIQDAAYAAEFVNGVLPEAMSNPTPRHAQPQDHLPKQAPTQAPQPVPTFPADPQPEFVTRQSPQFPPQAPQEVQDGRFGLPTPPAYPQQ